MKNILGFLINFVTAIFSNKNKGVSVDSKSSYLSLNNESEIPYDIDYRLKDDEKYIIRIRQNPPDGFTKLVAENVMVRKVTWASKIDNVLAFIQNSRRRIILEPSPKGIKVFGIWQSVRKERKAQLGWVPEGIAEELKSKYPDTPFAATLKTMFQPREDKSPGLRYDIWIP